MDPGIEEASDLSNSAFMDGRADLDELLSLEAALKASRWRERATAAQLSATTLVKEGYIAQYASANVTESGQSDLINTYGRLLQLLQELAIKDTQWQVREAAVDSAAVILQAMQNVISTKEVSECVWTVLASCADEQPEVQLTASKWISQQASSIKFTSAIADLCDKFVEAATSAKIATSTNANQSTRIELIGLDNLPGGEMLLNALMGAVSLQLLPETTLDKISSENLDTVPLLLAVATVTLDDANRRQSRLLARGLTCLLRSLGNKYQLSLLRMFDQTASVYLSGNGLAQFYRKAGLVNEDAFDLLSKLSAVTLLKGIAIALETIPADRYLSSTCLIDEDSQPREVSVKHISMNERVAIQHIIEMLHVPGELTLTLNVQEKDSKASEFIESAVLLLTIILSIMKDRCLDLRTEADARKLVDDMLLCCALFGNLDPEYGGSAVWTSKQLHKLSSSLLKYLSDAVNLTEPPRGGEMGASSSSKVSRLISCRISTLLPGLKLVIQGSSGDSSSESGHNYSTQETVSSSIIAAYRMHWILRQLEHPHLGPHCQMVMPCVLTALDHFSPAVKRQAMGACIHLAQNMNPSELRWFKEVILDAVTRSLTGCGDLWPVAVKMSVVMVSRVEGKNPRSSWFGKLLSEMMDELERHREDRDRRVVWLQEVSPCFEAMGLVLVAHFRRLLPLLYYWLHAPDDTTCILTLKVLQVVVRYTWPRMPAHVKRLWEELAQTFRESANKKSSSDIRAAVSEVCELLRLCTNSRFEAAWMKDMDDESIADLISSLKEEKQQILGQN